MRIGRRLFTLAPLLATLPVRAWAAEACEGGACPGTLFYVGTQGERPGDGIVAARLDGATGALEPIGVAAEIVRPTWLVRDPQRPLLYAVSEVGNDGKSHGSVYSLGIDRRSGRLDVLSHVDSGGGGPTHLSYDDRSHTLFTANYGDGRVTAIPVGPEGRLEAVVATEAQEGSGPHRRQAGPHAHGVTIDPTGAYLLSPDLGTDKVYVYRWDAQARTLAPAPTPWVEFPPGSGPRHLVFSPDGAFAFVNTELTGELYAFRWDASAARLTALGKLALDPPGFAGTRSASEIAVSADGGLLYASNRGANVIQVIGFDRETGALAERQRIGCGGTSPWSFSIDPAGSWLVVANQGSDSLSVLAIDRQNGTLSDTGHAMAVHKPVAITFVP